MDNRSTPEPDLDDLPIRYLRGGIFVRDPARAAAETPPSVRDWALTLSLSGLAALVGCVLGLLFR